MDIFTLGLISFILLFIYFEVTTLINMYPWNDLSKYTTKEKMVEATANGFIILGSLALFISSLKSLMIISTVIMFIFLLSQVLTWWMPYLTGRHLKQFPRSLYETHFKKKIKILPCIKDHIVPDAQHIVLQFLTLATFVACFIAMFD